MTTRPVDIVDYYAELGVRPDATSSEIAATYRALVKALHPDTSPTDPAAADRIKRVTVAYRVLADDERRRDYDERRRLAIARPVAPKAPGRATPPEAPPSRRGAHWALAGGVVCLVLGIAATALIISLQRHDADLRSRGTPATATVVQVGGERRLEFTTSLGAVVRASESVRTGTGEPRVGDQVRIRYDPARPTQVITTDDKFARDITLWIVAVKLLVVGLFFVGWGVHRLRRANAPSG
ncbi:MAG TPA: DnaJ domain-containing protein [Acidimicrobiia bacterium]|nr:DnaJ domain-containing protein [Acidimicrobiia bacterium]